jgi:hypothetical protein
MLALILMPSSILFTVSSALLPTLWYKANMKKPAKTVEEA